MKSKSVTWTERSLLSYPPYTEEVAKQGGSSRRVPGTGNDGPVMTGRLTEKKRAVQDRPALGIIRREHKARHPRQADRAGAHRAGLERNIERRSRQPLVGECRRTSAQDELLSMRRRIMAFYDAIAVGRQKRAIARCQRGANRHFAPFAGGLGFLQRQCYGFLVIHPRDPAFGKD